MRTRATLLSFSLVAGCTTWGTTTSYGTKREVGRTLRGEPGFATSSSSSLSAGFAGANTSRGVVAGLDAGKSSFTRTHCVQEAEVSYEQPYELQPVVVGRAKDLAAGTMLALAGLVILIGSSGTSSDYDYYAEEPAWNGGRVVGGLTIAAGAGLLVYSFAALPKSPRPEVTSGVNRWVATEIVEAQGCSAPTTPAIAQTASPAPPITPPAPSPDIAERLRTLDRLKASGTINEKEYQRKRAEILDGI